jgi:hypothetical protein
VQVNTKRNARLFLVGWWVVGFAGLTKPNYKPTMGGRCIETPLPHQGVHGLTDH